MGCRLFKPYVRHVAGFAAQIDHVRKTGYDIQGIGDASLDSSRRSGGSACGVLTVSVNLFYLRFQDSTRRKTVFSSYAQP